MVPPPWRLEISRPAQRDIDDLTPEMKQRVVDALGGLLAERAIGDVVKIQGSRDEFRLRVGEWRVRFQRDQASRTVVVTSVSPRGRAYRR